MSDPRWRGGDYYGSEPPLDGLAVARMIGHITYLSEPSLERKFGRAFHLGAGPSFTIEHEFAIESYLEYQGASFNTRFDANSYLYITKAMDYWDLPAQYGSLDAALAGSRAMFLLLSFTSDWLYPTSESLIIADALRRVGRPYEHVELESSAGHDAFLVDYDPQGPIVEEFLASLHT
jgi:homoserine O-acetyltransferase/O-succinyltransferase